MYCFLLLVPPTITSPNPKIVTVNESQTAQLECTVQGNPTPQVNWTRYGVLVGTGVYTTPAVAISDDNTCYTCIAYNGVLDAKTANVCLNVQCKYGTRLSKLSNGQIMFVLYFSNTSARFFITVFNYLPHKYSSCFSFIQFCLLSVSCFFVMNAKFHN